MSVTPPGAEPMTVEVLDNSRPSPLYTLLEAEAPSGVQGPWTGPAATHTPLTTIDSPVGPAGLGSGGACSLPAPGAWSLGPCGLGGPGGAFGLEGLEGPEAWRGLELGGAWGGLGTGGACGPAGPEGSEGPVGLNPHVYEVVQGGGPVQALVTTSLGAEVQLLPGQGVTAGDLPNLTDAVLNSFFSEFHHPPGHSPGTQDQHLGSATGPQYQGQEMHPPPGPSNLGTAHVTRGINRGVEPKGRAKGPKGRGSYKQLKRRAQSLLWNVRDIKRRLRSRLFHHTTSHRVTCPNHCEQALRYQEAELQLKLQRLSATYQALRLHELGPGSPSGPPSRPRGAGPPAGSPTPPPAHAPTVAPVGSGGQVAQAAQVATPGPPDLLDDLMNLTL